MVRKLIKILAIALLLFNGIGALYGGLSLMMYPDGSNIQLSMDWLEHTPFQNYFIPGLVLFIANGFFSIFVFMSLLLNHRFSARLVMAQGAILTGWIIIQVLMIQTVYILHYIFCGVGLGLIISGFLLQKLKATNS